MFFSRKKKMMKFVQLLEETLVEVDKAKEYLGSMHFVDVFGKTESNEAYILGLKDVETEMKELLKYAKNGVLYLKYGKKQREIESSYWVRDNSFQLRKTPIGICIGKVQDLYNKL